MRVLIVDDDSGYLTACAAVLRASGHDVTAAGTFVEGRRLLARQSIDLLIVDVRLGAYNGLHLLALAPPATLKIAMSAFADRVLQRETEQFGGRFVEKPGDYASLIAVLTAAAHEQSSPAGERAGEQGAAVCVRRSPGG
jgi:DNA-binding response OmpR family regulator